MKEEKILTENEIYTIYKEAEKLQFEGDYQSALNKFKSARKAYSCLYTELHESVLSCYLGEACIYRTIQRTDAAYVLFHLALLIAKEINFKSFRFPS